MAATRRLTADAARYSRLMGGHQARLSRSSR